MSANTLRKIDEQLKELDLEFMTLGDISYLYELKNLKKLESRLLLLRTLKSLIPRTPYFLTIGFHFTLMEQ